MFWSTCSNKSNFVTCNENYNFIRFVKTHTHTHTIQFNEDKGKINLKLTPHGIRRYQRTDVILKSFPKIWIDYYREISTCLFSPTSYFLVSLPNFPPNTEVGFFVKKSKSSASNVLEHCCSVIFLTMKIQREH